MRITALVLAGAAWTASARADFLDDLRRTFQKDIPRTFEQDIPRFFGAKPKETPAAAPSGKSKVKPPRDAVRR